MAGRTLTRIQVATCFCLVSAFTQICQSQINKDVPLEVTSSSPVAGVSGERIAIGMPMFCTQNDSVVVRLVGIDGGGQTAVLISPDGQQSVRFSSDSLYDIERPNIRGLFVNGSVVYLLAAGYSRPRWVNERVPTGSGGFAEQRVEVPTQRTFYIARFSVKGEYSRSVPLEVSFMPSQFGVFADGTYLVAGRTAGVQSEPRVALFRSNGQFLRSLELRDDLTDKSDQFKQGAENPILPGLNALSAVLDLSTIVADGDELLLIRKGSGAPVFAVTSGGEVRKLELKPPKQSALYSLHSAGHEWIAQYLYRRAGIDGVGLTSYAFDRQTGEPTASFNYAVPLGFGLACTDGAEFTFLEKGKDGALKIVRAFARRVSSAMIK